MLMAQRDDAQREHLMRFFKTGPGQYGEGDRFLGLKVPQTRALVKQIRLRVAQDEIVRLLYSPWHEVRLCALLLLVEEMKAGLPKARDSREILMAKVERRERIAELYLTHARQANNWDLVDLSCEYILGPYIRYAGDESYGILRRLALSDNLWEQRISVVTTLDFVRNGILSPSLAICDMLLAHPHDLIHKAVGWVLREVGKKDVRALSDYLEKNHSRIARTTLRYAIEKMNEAERHYWLHR
ncbi:MAG: DNA alkylation repair protein [Muribaculaceae bacterium]|nr:DNA alkylation repair protein [Muribaculaceae bacterium]